MNPKEARREDLDGRTQKKQLGEGLKDAYILYRNLSERFSL